MRAEFGLDSLPQHATHEVEPPTLIANPAMRLVENALRRYRARSGTPQRQQERWAGKPMALTLERRDRNFLADLEDVDDE